MTKRAALTATTGEVVGETFDDCTLQTLDRWLPTPETPNRYWTTAGPYEQSLEGLKGLPIVFAQKHPDPRVFAVNQEQALKAVNGRIAGTVLEGWIAKEGHPRLKGRILLTDPDAIQLQRDGKLSPSTGLFADLDRERKIAPGITWNHLLVFEERDGTSPRDFGAILNTLETEPMPDDQTTPTVLERVTAILEHLVHGPPSPVTNGPPAPDPEQPPAAAEPQPAAAEPAPEEPPMPDIEKLKKEVEDGKTALTNATSELETLKAERDQVLAEKTALENTLETTKAELATLQADRDALAAEKDKSDYEAFLNLLPPGKKDSDEKLAGLREEWTKDAAGLKLRMANTILNLAGPTQPAGTSHEQILNGPQGRKRKIPDFNLLTKQPITE